MGMPDSRSPGRLGLKGLRSGQTHILLLAGGTQELQQHVCSNEVSVEVLHLDSVTCRLLNSTDLRTGGLVCYTC